MPAHPKPPKKQRRPGRRVGKVTGTIRLYGKQRKDLRTRVFERSRGYCEAKLDGCLGYASIAWGHMAHVKSVGSGGPDEIGNVLWSCTKCHSKSHTEGIRLKEVIE